MRDYAEISNKGLDEAITISANETSYNLLPSMIHLMNAVDEKFNLIVCPHDDDICRSVADTYRGLYGGYFHKMSSTGCYYVCNLRPGSQLSVVSNMWFGWNDNPDPHFRGPYSHYNLVAFYDYTSYAPSGERYMEMVNGLSDKIIIKAIYDRY